MPGKEEELSYEDIYEPLEGVWLWMRKAGLREVPDVDVLYNEAILLAEAMQKDITDYYRGCANPTTACHKWHFRATNGELYVRSIGDKYSERCLDNAFRVFSKPLVPLGLQPLLA